jgi:K+-sensing histidine kinase KdpD
MSRKTILVIEDEASLRNEIGEILQFEDYEIITAENGKLGVRSALINLPDLILCDIMMPFLDGNQVLKKLRENESTMLIPFVFMTALAERQNVRLGMDAGADDYITKPFTSDELISAINMRFKKQEAIQVKKEQELDQLRTNIITRLPHELRSPLSGIIGFGSLLKDMADSLTTEDVTDIGNEILESGNRLLRLIENYLVFVQLQLREPKIETTSGDAFIAAALEISRATSQKYNRQSLLKIKLSETPSIQLSEICLRKIVSELCDNAFRFSPPESAVSITGTADSKQYTLTIADQGRGLTKEQINHIGAYMQFDRDKLEQQGSGLGLIIAKKMTELSGGLFEIQSEKDKGTTIKMVFKK